MQKLIIFIKAIANKVSKDRISDYASSASYFIVLSFFPFLLALLSLIRFLPLKENDLLKLINNVLPTQLRPIVTTIFTDIYDNSSTALTLITAIALLWAASKGFMAIIKGLKQIYNKTENKIWILQRILSCFYALFFMILIIVSLVLMVFGQYIINFIDKYLPKLGILLEVFQALIDTKHLLLPSILMIFFTLAFSLIAKRKGHFYRDIPGALFSSLGWYLFTALYSFYVSISPNFSYMYGSLTTFIFALVWLYFCIIIIFIGAEINYFINDYKPHNIADKSDSEIISPSDQQ